MERFGGGGGGGGAVAVGGAVVPDHNPDHVLVCGGCGDFTRGTAEDVRSGKVTPPPCIVEGHDPERTRPKLGYPLQEWVDANRGHGRHAAFIAKYE